MNKTIVKLIERAEENMRKPDAGSEFELKGVAFSDKYNLCIVDTRTVDNEISIRRRVLRLIHYQTEILVLDITNRRVDKIDGYTNSDQKAINTVLEYFKIEDKVRPTGLILESTLDAKKGFRKNVKNLN